MPFLSIDAITATDGIGGKSTSNGARADFACQPIGKTYGMRPACIRVARADIAPPMQLEIVETDHPTDADRQAVLSLLVEYNASRVGELPFRQYALLLRDPGYLDPVGGLYAYALYDWLSIELLIIPEAYRGYGFGTELMRRAEAYAADARCVGVWLNTFSFQALGFYQKLGYEVFGSLDDHPQGSQRYFLRKRLVPGAQRA